MMRIPLTTRLPKPGSPFPGSVIDSAIIKQLVTQGQPGIGMDLEEMRQGMKILDALDAPSPTGDDVLVLEDAQYNFLVKRVREFRWGIADQRFLDLSDAIIQAERSK